MKNKPQPRLRTMARRLLDLFGVDGKHWTTGTLARTKKGGMYTEPKDDDAGAWCLMGGLEKIDQLDQRNTLREAIETHTEHNYSSVEDFNDSHRWPTIRAFLMKLAHPYQPKQTR
jgi:hypothetical protein